MIRPIWTVPHQQTRSFKPTGRIRFGETPKRSRREKILRFLDWSHLLLSATLMLGGAGSAIYQAKETLQTKFSTGEWKLIQQRYLHPQTPWTDLVESEANRPVSKVIEQLKAHPNLRFEHYKADSAKPDKMVPVRNTGQFDAIEKTVASRIAKMLYYRPDVLENFLKNPRVIKIYDVPSLKTGKKDDDHIAGLAFPDGPMSFTVKHIQESQEPGDGFDVVVHETTHELDNMDSNGHILEAFDGLLPMWTAEERQRFIAAREIERTKIRKHQSPIRDYALKENSEFLTCAIEVYFENPLDLHHSNPELYKILDDTFRHRLREKVLAKDPSASGAPTNEPTEAIVILGGGAFLVVFCFGFVLLNPIVRHRPRQQPGTPAPTRVIPDKKPVEPPKGDPPKKD